MSDRQVLTVDELSALTGLPGRTIRGRLQAHGTIFGVAPIPDTGKRILLSRVLIEQALHGERAAS